MGKSRAAEHRLFFAWLLEIINSRQVDALIVAGDIFDTGSPPSYAREMYNRFIVDIHRSGCQLIILAGNHDSVATLNESREILACLNTHVISCVADDSSNFIIPLGTRTGETGAILCAIPFIRSRDVTLSHSGQSTEEKQQAMQQAIAAYYQDLYQQADNYRKENKLCVPVIMSGHLATVGASTTDSVRDIYIGTLNAFPASAFPAADYIALGHIHKPQKVAKSEHIRYSGSPLALSFDEATSSKSVLLLEFEGAKLKQLDSLKIPVWQPMRIIKGDLKQIEKQLKSLPDSFELDDEQRIWVEVVVSAEDYINDLQTHIQKFAEDLPIDILRLRRERKQQASALQIQQKETLQELAVMDVFERRLREEYGEMDDSDKENRQRQERIRHYFKQVLEQLETGTVTGSSQAE